MLASGLATPGGGFPFRCVIWQSARRSPSTAQSLATLSGNLRAAHRALPRIWQLWVGREKVLASGLTNPRGGFRCAIWQSARRSPSTAQNIWQLWVGRETVGWRVVWRPREEVFDLGSARKKVRGERRADCQIAHRKPPHPQDPVGPFLIPYAYGTALAPGGPR